MNKYTNVDEYKPFYPFRNGQFNTIYTALFRKPLSPSWQRARVETDDGDFFDIDQLFSNNKNLAILLHGLEGSSSSQYMLGLSSCLHQDSYDVIAVNHRSCSGEMNRLKTMYNSGFTHDLHHLISQYESNYTSIFIIGFSLGGNIVLKYVNDAVYPISPKIKRVVGVSVPIDLSGSLQEIIKPKNFLYDRMFKKSLMDKLKQKHKQFPEAVPIHKIDEVKTLWHIDEFFTGPMHGYDGAEHYYASCSALPFLVNTRIPTLLINAQDDPFLSGACYPYRFSDDHPYFSLLAPKYGGHVGFYSSSRFFWHEKQIVAFLNAEK